MGCLARTHLKVQQLPRGGGYEGKPYALELKHAHHGLVQQASTTIELVAEMTHFRLTADRLGVPTRYLRQLVVVAEGKLVTRGLDLQLPSLASETTSTPKKSSK